MITKDNAKQMVMPGWSKLIDEVYDRFSDESIIDVKEKFGGLRVYLDAYQSDEDFEFLEDIEKKSFTVCEVCGNPGKPITIKGWTKTVCEAHDKTKEIYQIIAVCITGNSRAALSLGVQAIAQKLPFVFEFPCGNIFKLMSINELPVTDTPCPCGNQNHWYVKYVIMPSTA